MNVLGPKEAEGYLAFVYYLKYANGVEVLTPVLYGPPRIGKSDILRRSFKTFVKLLAKRIVENDFLGIFGESSEELKERHAPLINVIATGNKALISEALEEADEESVFISATFALADKCDVEGPCSELNKIVSKIEGRKAKEFYENLIASRAFSPTKGNLRAWDEGVLVYGEGIDIGDYEDKAVYVELTAEELGEEDLKGFTEKRGDYFVRLPPRWAKALASSAVGLLHFENATALPWDQLSKILGIVIRKRVGMFKFNKLGVLSGPDPFYAKVTLIPSYVSSGNLEFVAVRAPTVREWREQLDEEGEWAEEVYYFLQVTSPNYGEGIRYKGIAPIVEEVSKSVRSSDAYLPPPEVARSFERSFTPYPTPKAWKAFAKALALGKSEVMPLAYSYLGDETVADLFVDFFSYFVTLQDDLSRVREVAQRRELGAKVALAALAFKALEGDEEARKALEEAGLEKLLQA